MDVVGPSNILTLIRSIPPYWEPLRRTFAELSPDAKNGVSHRGRAVRKLRAFLEREREALSGARPDRARTVTSARSRRPR